MYKINARLQEAIYVQIMNCIKNNIIEQKLKEKDKIPSVREMARILTTNPNTVAKAYKELEQQKVIVVEKGRGTFIAVNPFDGLKSNNDEKLIIKRQLKKLVKQSKYYGISIKQMKQWMDEE